MKTLTAQDRPIGPEEWRQYYPFFMNETKNACEYALIYLDRDKVKYYNQRQVIANRLRAALMETAHIEQTILYFGATDKESKKLIEDTLKWLDEFKMEYRKNG